MICFAKQTRGNAMNFEHERCTCPAKALRHPDLSLSIALNAPSRHTVPLNRNMHLQKIATCSTVSSAPHKVMGYSNMPNFKICAFLHYAYTGDTSSGTFCGHSEKETACLHGAPIAVESNRCGYRKAFSEFVHCLCSKFMAISRVCLAEKIVRITPMNCFPPRVG